MAGHKHLPDDGRWYTTAGAKATCYLCRRVITFVAGFDKRRDYWRASGPFGNPLPTSKRCTSRNPAVGWSTCDMARNHSGTCHNGGYVWYRGKGHSRPHLVSRPAWDRVA